MSPSRSRSWPRERSDDLCSKQARPRGDVRDHGANDGDATHDLVRLYSDLARGGVGLIITGHINVEPRRHMTPALELDHDGRIRPLPRITHAVHRHGGIIFAQLSHAGSQSLIPELEPLAPSLSCRTQFSRGRRWKCLTLRSKRLSPISRQRLRARSAPASTEFTFIRGTATLLSQFNSPYTNRRCTAGVATAKPRSVHP